MRKAKSVLVLALFLFLMLCLPVQAQGNTAGKASVRGTVKLHFYDEDGQEYIKLRNAVKKNTYVYLPQLPTVEGYKNLGWSLKKGGPVRYKAGAKVKAGKTVKLYAVRRVISKTCTVSFFQKTGETDTYSEAMHMTVEKNSLIELPTVKNPAGKTFLGWSRNPSAESNPDFKEGEKLRADKDITLYAVMFDRSTERNITYRNLYQVDNKKYAKVIFVGDSRTNAMKLALKDEFGNKEPRNVSFVAKNGKGLKWFKGNGSKLLMKEISAARGKPTAVIINLGVNDLKHDEDNLNFSVEKTVRKYILYMNQLADKLRGRNCKLFYMSVNPVSGAMVNKQANRREGDIHSFNCAIRKGLKGKYRFIDTNTWLRKTGFSTGRLYQELDDGVHYQARTYKRIYNYCIRKVNAAA